MLEKFVSVTRATLKGTILIGAAQGILGGLAFWAVGLDGAIFWGTVMTVLSIIPGIGGALIWVPAVIILITTGEVWRGIGLALFCALVVGSVDNLLRPMLVGKDIQMHELLIFFSTLGGLMLFGAMGFILGPILAALFVTAWEMFGTAFQQRARRNRNPARDKWPRVQVAGRERPSRSRSSTRPRGDTLARSVQPTGSSTSANTPTVSRAARPEGCQSTSLPSRGIRSETGWTLESSGTGLRGFA